VLFDHVFAALLVVGLPVHAQLVSHALVRRVGRGLPRARMQAYAVAVLTQWALAAVAAGRWLATGRPWPELGLAEPAAGSAGYSILILFLAAAAAVRVWSQVGADPDARRTVRAQFAAVEALLPRSAGERNAAWLVAVTAGVCEELLFRGYLFWWLRGFVGELPAMALAALSFGLCHAYQGWRGVAKTTFVGLSLGALVLVTESLALAVALHAFIDLNAFALAHAVLAREEEDDPLRGLDAWLDAAPDPDAGETEDEGWGGPDGGLFGPL
jgi:membrane protease YdiL (CAAX protease family)